MSAIIIEGGDHVGKTSAAELLAASTGQRVDHNGVKPATYHHFYDRLTDLDPEADLIYDRFHLSGFVYGHLGGLHPTGLTPQKLHMLMNWIRFKGIPVVIMFDSDERSYIKRMEERPKREQFAIENRIVINAMYAHLSSEHLFGTPFCQVAWDISERGFPNDEEVQRWTRINPRTT